MLESDTMLKAAYTNYNFINLPARGFHGTRMLTKKRKLSGFPTGSPSLLRCHSVNKKLKIIYSNNLISIHVKNARNKTCLNARF